MGRTRTSRSSIARRTYITYTLIACLFMALGGVAVYTARSVQDAYENSSADDKALIDSASVVRSEIQSKSASLMKYVTLPGRRETYGRDLDTQFAECETFNEAIYAQFRTPEQDQAYDRITELEEAYEDMASEAMALAASGREAEALALIGGEGETIQADLLASVQVLDEAVRADIDERHADLTRRLNIVGFTVTGGSFALFALVLGFAFVRSAGDSRRLSSAIEELATSSAEMLAITAQVAGGAQETASSIAQTTATVEQVKQTSSASAKRALEVSESAREAADIAEAGRRSVESSVDGMHNIIEQTTLVADSIMRLSEQTQAVGEIINTVNAIAEQSNLLSVNAAIEAAKAGEHGQGFTVVAQEVKRLTEQSKRAVTQIRLILEDIQKASGTAVMATEKSNKAIAAGVRQSLESGQAISALAERVAQAAQATMQIATSNKQQLTGMDQISDAMDAVNEAGKQNVYGMRQVEQEVRRLQELAQELGELVTVRATRERAKKR